MRGSKNQDLLRVPSDPQLVVEQLEEAKAQVESDTEHSEQPSPSNVKLTLKPRA